jgi:hypothetical protein
MSDGCFIWCKNGAEKYLAFKAANPQINEKFRYKNLAAGNPRFLLPWGGHRK